MCKAVFRLMGRDYEAAVMSAGFCGFMLGTAANAMASMTVLRDKFGQAPRAFLIVPLVGVSLIDFVNALMVNGLAGLLHR
jgi:ESS family glutamate:Na+ symporter